MRRNRSHLKPIPREQEKEVHDDDGNTEEILVDDESTGETSEDSSEPKTIKTGKEPKTIQNPIRTHGSGSYVGLASWAWFSIERFKTVRKRCLYSPARI